MTSLRGGADFHRALEQGQRCADHLLALRALRRQDAGAARVGIVTGRRLGKAVQRNRIRRWVRESARAALARASGAWDLVLIPRETARTATHDQLRQSISRLLRRAGVLGDDLPAS